MVKKGIPNEDRLIFLSDRTKVNVSTQQRIKKLLDNPLDWNKIIKISHQHQILPLLYCTLNELKLSNIVPQDTFSILKKSYYLNLVRNTRLWHEFLSVLKSANGSGLKIALLKGISLIKTVYHNPALRIITDIDILIKEAEMLKLKNILLQLDYQENSKDFTTKKYYERHKISFDFSKQISPNLYLLLEVHRGLAPQRPYKINLPHIWKRIEEKTIDGQRVAFLSPEDTFLSLVLHLRQNTRNLLLKFICDTAELLNQCGHRFDWDYIEKEVKRNHIISIVYFSIYISKELFNTSVPTEVLKRFQPSTLKNKSINLCMNRHNFLTPKRWQGYILRLLFFDKPIDFLFYLWRVSFMERFIIRQGFRKISKKRIKISKGEIIKK